MKVINADYLIEGPRHRAEAGFLRLFCLSGSGTGDTILESPAEVLLNLLIPESILLQKELDVILVRVTTDKLVSFVNSSLDFFPRAFG